MNTYRILHGDALTMLRTLPADSVHCVVTSPPYWGLRDYGHDEQIGLEETPDAYVARLVDVFREVRRVLREDGTCWLNLGDSYARTTPNHGLGGGIQRNGLTPESTAKTRMAQGLKDKDLVGIPWRVGFALQADGWWLRQDIIWHKTAPMPESVTDRCTKAHEYVFLLTKSARYFYDAQAIAEPSTGEPQWRDKMGEGYQADYPNGKRFSDGGRVWGTATRNKRSVWTLVPEPYAEAHFATMPPTLAELCIRAGSSAHGCCSYCGAPWERVVERQANGKQYGNANGKEGALRNDTAAWAGRVGETQTETIGWQPTCTHEAERIPCTVLDPFAGSGTTLAVALANGRNSIGIELNAEYIRLAEKRITGTQPALFGV